MSPDHPSEQGLSAEGVRRKQAILLASEQALGNRTRTRRARRAIAAMVLLVACATGLAAILTLRPPSGSSFAPTAPRSSPDSTVARGASPASPASPASYQTIDDDELLRELTALGHDIGLVHVNSETRLITSAGQPVDLSRIVQPTG